MSRRLVVPALLLAAVLLLAGPAAAGDAVSLTVSPMGGNQFVFTVQNTGDTVIQSFVLVPGGGFNAGGVISTTGGSCSLSGGSVACSGLSLAPGCPCSPGQSVAITLSGSGDPAGSTVADLVGAPAPAGTNAPAPTPVSVNTPSTAHTTTTPAKPKVVTLAKKIPRCKKGQHSTKKKPCRK
jgi:hypothetical protein